MSNGIVQALDQVATRVSKAVGKDAGKAVEDLYRDAGGRLKDVIKNTVEADAGKAADIKKILDEMDHNAAKRVTNDAERTTRADTNAVLHKKLAEILDPKGEVKAGPVTFRPPKGGASPDEIAQMRQYVAGCNKALEDGALSPTGRVSTSGKLRAEASAAAREEGRRAAAAGTPYAGNVGHVPDTTWVGRPNPPSWQDLAEKVNKSLGAQARGYPVGYKPTRFLFEE
ncbi:hypothetical protein KGA66_21545 [Actinocrinis puniceicyclus]|uniref:Uncharacterized protein n=1 Tax=Actinocrinis puniceicyclus TaxID=977794 RepID=A0A8J8BEK5_9ACTN|nr:hypothetical protein [Actinocrinis puniceicyclus]MBS2965650.1 hypothetical protein [Actinocrinis puniceicyclus]